MDDVSLHGKDNQQAVEILKQTGPVVRLKMARHVNRRLSGTQTPSLVSTTSSAGVAEISPEVEQIASAVNEPKKGKNHECFTDLFRGEPSVSDCVDVGSFLFECITLHCCTVFRREEQK